LPAVWVFKTGLLKKTTLTTAATICRGIDLTAGNQHTKRTTKVWHKKIISDAATIFR